jgi:hypothetical protein
MFPSHDLGQKYYTVGLNNGELWIENQDNEGMTMAERNLYDLLDEYFKDNF